MPVVVIPSRPEVEVDQQVWISDTRRFSPASLIDNCQSAAAAAAEGEVASGGEEALGFDVEEWVDVSVPVDACREVIVPMILVGDSST